MKITLLYIGKNYKSFISEAEEMYAKRIKKYIPFDIKCIPDIKNAKKLSPNQIKDKETELILKHIPDNSHIVLLDEKGKEFNSKAFAQDLNKKMIHVNHNLVFIIGGAYGFSKSIYEKANEKLSLSKMTYSHQIIRIFFLEQLYRAFTILNNEPYHNE